MINSKKGIVLDRPHVIRTLGLWLSIRHAIFPLWRELTLIKWLQGIVGDWKMVNGLFSHGYQGIRLTPVAHNDKTLCESG